MLPRRRAIGYGKLQGMDIRDQRPHEKDAVTRVITEAFADEGRVATVWANVVIRKLDRASIVAVDEGVVIGHVGVSHAWLDARQRLIDVLVLSPLSVQPRRQGHGVGTALVSAAIAAADRMSVPALFLEGDPGYYGNRGFDRASGHGFEAPSRRIPESAFQVALLSSHAEWMTGRVIYRDVWWEGDAAGLRDPDLARIERVL